MSNLKSFDNTNSGALFINDKEGNMARPDLKGHLNINGGEFYLSAWVHEYEGKEIVNLQLEEKDQNARQHRSKDDPSHRAVLFINERKTDANQPDRSGRVNLLGQEFWLSAWEKTSQAGNPFVSLSVRAKEQNQQPQNQGYQQAAQQQSYQQAPQNQGYQQTQNQGYAPQNANPFQR